MPRPLCLYHKNCLDGSAAAAVVRRRVFGCEVMPVQYGQPLPQVAEREVWLVDFSFPLEDMRRLRAQARSLVWIDHHDTSIELNRRLGGWGVIDTAECGASLAWRELMGGQPLPELIAYVRDKDLWQWKLPDSRAIAAGLAKSFPRSQVDGLLEADLPSMAELGRGELAAQEQRVVKVIAEGRVVEGPFGLAGLRAFVAVCGQDQNEVAERACAPAAGGGLGCDLAVLYYRKGADGPWIHSLRAPAVDVGALAQARGGGGHARSACFISDKPAFGAA